MDDDTARNWDRIKIEAAKRGDRWSEQNMDIDGAGGFIDTMPQSALISRTIAEYGDVDDRSGRAIRVTHASRRDALAARRA
jgi:hypothetical protein